MDRRSAREVFRLKTQTEGMDVVLYERWEGEEPSLEFELDFTLNGTAVSALLNESDVRRLAEGVERIRWVWVEHRRKADGKQAPRG